MNIYKNYSQQQLNDQYNTRLRVPGYASYFDRWERLSRATDHDCKLVADLAYGDDILERLDIFPAEKPGAATLVFIHGGYWHLLDKSLFHFLAPPFLQRNITTVLINYPLAPAATIDNIVTSCSRAIFWVKENIARYHGDASKIYVTGHSAGGHLAAMLVTRREFHFIKGVVSLSGLFRLEPIVHSYVNEVLGMDMAMAERNSPVLLKPLNHGPLLLATGDDESEEFQSQSWELRANWQPEHQEIESLQVSGKNHYSILETLVEDGSSVQASLFAMMAE